MPDCVQCGQPLSEGQSICPTCRGDPYYAELFREWQRWEEEKERWEQAMEDEHGD